MNELTSPQFAIMVSLAISMAVVATVRAITYWIERGRKGGTRTSR